MSPEREIDMMKAFSQIKLNNNDLTMLDKKFEDVINNPKEFCSAKN